MQEMLAARMYGANDMRVEMVPIPEINEHEILLKVENAAICGTDLRMYANGYKDISETNPRILGHEFAGTIAKIGSGVEFYKEGMRVAVAPNMGCGVCEYCTSGKGHLCETFFQAPGINIDGGFAEYVRIPEPAVRQGNIIPIDERISYAEAALNEPLSCVYNAFQKVRVEPGDNVLIIGAGPIGLMHSKLARMAGAANVMINDLSQERLDICKKIDPKLIAIHSSVLEEQVKIITKNKGLNVCITANPSPITQKIAIGLMAVEGRVNFFGGLPKDKEIVDINTNTIHYKELTVTGTTKASVAMFAKTLKFLEEGLITVSDLISGYYELKDIVAAFETAKSATGLKNVITFK